MAMYKRSLEALINTPPNLQKSGQRCIAECQFGKAGYFYVVSPCIRAYVDAGRTTYVIIRK